jgi:hypothetical protein
VNAPTPLPVATELVIGQIGRTVGMFLIQAQYPGIAEQEEVIKRLMMGERIAIAVAGRIAYVHRDTEFDTWYLRRA